jgi:flagellar biosynthetic protein FliQ
MDPATVLDIGRDAIILLIKISAPIMIIALVVGLVVSLFQALTQIQEQTLTFVPKILAIFITLIITLPFIGKELQIFSEKLASMIISGG